MCEHAPARPIGEWGRALLCRVQYVDKEIFTTTLLDAKDAYCLALRCASKSQARTARDPIIEEHKCGAWPPFVVAYAFPSIVRLIELAVDGRMPGAAVLLRPSFRGP